VDRNARAAAQLTSLYDAHAADAFRYALHLTGRREDAEDVVQHVFLQAYAMLEAGRELVNPRAWLVKATKHRSLNLLRDRRDTPAAQIDPPAPFAPGEGESEALAEVRAALWSLPETQHHAFVLRHWSGLSQDEIADVLETTPGAVESLLVRARATLVAEREEGDPECVGVRGRLAQMLAPTPEQTAHLAGCRRCRTAQTRLRRAAEFATAFALVPSPHVLHALAAAIPGFGATGAAAGVSAAGAAVGTGTVGAGTGGAAVSTVSTAAKTGILTKVALAATTAAVAVTAAHPVRSTVSHAIFRQAPSASAAAPTRAASHTVPSATEAAGRSAVNGPGAAKRTPPGKDGGGTPEKGGAGNGGPAARSGGEKGKSGTAGTNGKGKGQGAGASGDAAPGRSGSAPGRTKPAGGPATGNGNANGARGSTGEKPDGGGTSGPPTTTKTTPGGGVTKTTTATGGGAAGGNGNGKGNGKASDKA
jgi:RNA polymerase sigma factor (sigma-70 family)